MDTVTLTRAEYDDLIDARDHAQAMREIVSGAMETLTAAEVKTYLVAPTPLAFWRKQRGLTQAALAAAVGITQPYLAQIEHDKRSPDVKNYAKLAKALGVLIDDLVVEDDD